MSPTPHYQSAQDARAENRQRRPGLEGLTTIAFVISLGALAKAGMVSAGIAWDEKTPSVLILLGAAGLATGSLLVNLKKRRPACVTFNLLSFGMLLGALVLVAQGWR